MVWPRCYVSIVLWPMLEDVVLSRLAARLHRVCSQNMLSKWHRDMTGRVTAGGACVEGFDGLVSLQYSSYAGAVQHRIARNGIPSSHLSRSPNHMLVREASTSRTQAPRRRRSDARPRQKSRGAPSRRTFTE